MLVYRKGAEKSDSIPWGNILTMFSMCSIFTSPDFLDEGHALALAHAGSEAWPCKRA